MESLSFKQKRATEEIETEQNVIKKKEDGTKTTTTYEPEERRKYRPAIAALTITNSLKVETVTTSKRGSTIFH